MKVEVAVVATPVPNSPYGLCGRKGTFEEVEEHSGSELRSCGKVEVAVLGFLVPNSPWCPCGSKATFEEEEEEKEEEEEEK